MVLDCQHGSRWRSRASYWLLALMTALAVTGCRPVSDASSDGLAAVAPIQTNSAASRVSGPRPVAGKLPSPQVGTLTAAPTVLESTRTLSLPALRTDTATPSPTRTARVTATRTPAPSATSIPSPTPLPTATPPPWPLADRPPDRIVAPHIGLDAQVVEVGWRQVQHNGRVASEWIVADYAAGFHKGSAYPGQVGNTVISGHHNIRGEVFRYLVELQPGDTVYLYVGGQEFPYIVRQRLVIPERYASAEQQRENARWIGYFPDARLTLVTCWPYVSNTHRVIVIAQPVGSEQ